MNLSGWSSDRLRSWPLMDRILAAYTAWVALLIVVRWPHFATPASLLASHLAILALLVVLPPRGREWERRKPGEGIPRKLFRIFFRFLRHTYPLLLVIFYFEEAAQTVNLIAGDTPYWFEKLLFAADEKVFGVLPALGLAQYQGPLLDEVMHFFYFSYYLIILGGPVFAFFGSKFGTPPARGFETVITSCIAAYLVAFVWYPFLPARGPWENAAVMAGLPEFQGGIFTAAIQAIIKRGAVSGACFPSGHVAGTWGVVFGMAPFYPRIAGVLAFVAAGMSFACVYTRYHHAVDVPAGLLAAAIGFWLTWAFRSRREADLTRAE